MKKTINLFFLIFAFNSAYTQPTNEMIDLYEGSSFSFEYFTKNDIPLYISDWSNSKNHNEFYVLKKKAGDNKNPFKSFSIKKSEIDSSFHNFHFILNSELMTIKLNKNYPRVILNIKRLRFKKGVYFIDLKKLYSKYDAREIELNEFPSKCKD